MYPICIISSRFDKFYIIIYFIQSCPSYESNITAKVIRRILFYIVNLQILPYGETKRTQTIPQDISFDGNDLDI